MRTLISIYLVTFLSFSVKSQVAEGDTTSEDKVFDFVEVMPEFPGGTNALMEYMAQNITYPDSAKNNGIQGKVFIKFVISKEGLVENVKVIRGIGYGCDDEGVRVISAMPRWTPGKMKGEPVDVYYTLPIYFKLE